MKIALAQLNFILGDFEGNYGKISTSITQAIKDGVDLICFSELAVCGYPPRDFLEFDDFIARSNGIIERISKQTQQIAVIVGAPAINPVPEGKDLYNALYFIHEGEIKFIQYKTLLPTYDIFDDYRYFEPNRIFDIVRFKGKKIALTICEDIWNIDNDNPLYTINPVEELRTHKPDILINASGSPFDYQHMEERLEVIKGNIRNYPVPIFYVNQVGAHTDLIFDGGSLVVSPNTEVYDQFPLFEEDYRTYDLDEVIQGRECPCSTYDTIEVIHDALVLGIKDYFEKLGFKRAILGLSGGIDSALTAVLAARALGPDNVMGVLMPSGFSSSHSIPDAMDLIKNLGIRHHTIPIGKRFDDFIQDLSPLFQGRKQDVTEENIQPRIRMIYLMAISNKLGYILLNTTNKSEMAVGYGTLYGDLAGGLSVLGDVYKTQVFELCKYINRKEEIIPEHIITKPPSAELRPDQKDSDSLPPYDVLDPILFQYIELQKGPEEIMASGADPSTVRRALRLVNMNEFKRYQTAPVLRVSPKAFGIGRRLPIVGKYLL